MENRVQNQFPSTYEFHKDRERAPHLEQPQHRNRLLTAEIFIRSVKPLSVSDLGCGDGGLLSLIKDIPSWGYDFTPSMAAGWTERGVEAYSVDVFNERHTDKVTFGELSVMTEVLEHLADPHDVLNWVSQNSRWIVVSSPWGETLDPTLDGYVHDCHIWAWDMKGYKDMISKHYNILTHKKSTWSQVVLAESKNYESSRNRR